MAASSTWQDEALAPLFTFGIAEIARRFLLCLQFLGLDRLFDLARGGGKALFLSKARVFGFLRAFLCFELGFLDDAGSLDLSGAGRPRGVAFCDAGLAGDAGSHSGGATLHCSGIIRRVAGLEFF